MDMGRERLTLGLLLRLGILLAAVFVCLHVYLETARQRAPAAQASGRPTQSSQNRGRQSRTKQVSAEAEERDRSVKRRISYVRTPKKDSPVRKRDEDREELSPRCCPPPRPRRKVSCASLADEQGAQRGNKGCLGCVSGPQIQPEPQDTKQTLQGLLFRLIRLICILFDEPCRAVPGQDEQLLSDWLGVDDRSLERSLTKAGCEVHCFDPSLKQPHLQQAEMWLHRLSVDWRDPNPAIVAQRQYANTKKLATILNDFGHRQVDVLKADMESAEWKILENLVLEGVLDSVGQLLLELHLHWAGFEVGGDDPSVVRYWFSLLKELERANFRLFHVHSDPAKPHLFLHKNVHNASSAYTVSWVNTQWKP
ncbi:Methyltransferase-like protein 24 [Nibea albiflora]|uniref:Methyltransferase-like protein 24 n=1 Tax=Nibea albiflora TaxID=240163 RepID=A0ACB7FAT4_NIBAL|nr:Methyltransferase-like protein 24 [Nibea albiflora]